MKKKKKNEGKKKKINKKMKEKKKKKNMKKKKKDAYSPTILDKVLSLVLQIFLYNVVVYECNTTSDWLNRIG